MEDAIAELAAAIIDVNYRVAAEGYGVAVEVRSVAMAVDSGCLPHNPVLDLG